MGMWETLSHPKLSPYMVDAGILIYATMQEQPYITLLSSL